MVQMKLRSLLDSPNTNSELLKEIRKYEKEVDDIQLRHLLEDIDTWDSLSFGYRYFVIFLGLIDIPGLYSGYFINCQCGGGHYWTFFAPIDLVEEIEENFRDNLDVSFYALGYDTGGFPKFQVVYEKSDKFHNIFGDKNSKNKKISL